MVSVKGTFRNGRAEPEEAVEGREGQPVIIMSGRHIMDAFTADHHFEQAGFRKLL